MMKKQNRTYTDSILMRLCKNKARQKGYYSDEPQYKAYCTKLYNATKEGRGLSGLAGDASNVDTAERLTKIFKAIGFPYRVEAQGKFLDFYDINPDADEPLLFDDEAEDVFYDQFGKVVNFKILISQFYDRDEKVKKYVEKHLSQKSRAKKSAVEPFKTEVEQDAVEVKKIDEPKSVKRKAEKVVEPTEPEENEDEREVQSEQSKPNKTTSKFDGELGGLKYHVLTAEEYKTALYAADAMSLVRERGSRIPRVSSIENLPGYKLLNQFGLPSFSYTNDGLKKYAKWAIRVEDLGILVISSGSEVRDDEIDYRGIMLRDMTMWWVFLLLDPQQESITEQQCDHASHFFGDSFFANAQVKIPLKGCGESTKTATTTITDIDPQYSVNAIKTGTFSDKENNTYEWSYISYDEAYRLLQKYGFLRQLLIADNSKDYLKEVNKLKIFADSKFVTKGSNKFYPIVVKKNNGVPSLFVFGFNDPKDKKVTIPSLYLHSYIWQNIIKRKGELPNEYSLLECDTAKALIKHIGLKMRLKSPCNQSQKSMKGVSDCCSDHTTTLGYDKASSLTPEDIESFDIDDLVIAKYDSNPVDRYQMQYTVVAKYLDTIVGYIQYSTMSGENTAYIEDVMVYEDLRRKGIASALYDYVKNLGLEIETFGDYKTEEGTLFRSSYDSKNKKLESIVIDLVKKFGIELDAYEYKDHIVISRIVVPKSKRNEGIGTEAIEAIIEYADEQGKDVFVTPTGDFGGSISRLAKFYKRFGFVPNKGKYRDFRTRESMIYKAEGINDDMSRHQAPYRDEEGFFQPAYDVSRMFPGIYTSSFSKALREYGTGSDSDPESLQIIRNIHNNPEAKVKIYRAVEKGLRDNINDLKKDRDYIKRNGSVPPWSDIPPGNTDEYSMFVDSQIENLGAVESATITPTINPKDWVTISRQYAVDHGECCVPGDYTILSKTVKAKDLYTEGNSIHEWGYDPSQDSSLSGDSFTPPKDVQEEAERGLEWRREYGRGGTEVGVARARDLSKGRSVSYDTVKRMKAFFDRHEVDKQAEGFRPNEQGYPSAGRIAWALWGGDAGYRWAKSIVGKSTATQGLGSMMFADQLEGTTANVQEKEEPKEVAPLTTQEIVNMEPPQTLPLKGELRDFLSSLLAKFNMLIWGGAGSGKSSFVLRLANELAETNTGRVLYYMTEEKVSSGRLKARMDLMKAYSDNVNFDDHGTFDRLTALVNTGMYRYVIVDSINMINVEQTKIVELMQTFPEVSWIFIAQATKGKNAYAGIQSLAHAVDTEIATSNDKGTAVAELKKHRDGALKTHTIFGNTGMRDPKWQAQW